MAHDLQCTSSVFRNTSDVDVRGNLKDNEGITKQYRVQQKLTTFCWHWEYLTDLTQHTESSGNNLQTISVGDVDIYMTKPHGKLAVEQQWIPRNNNLAQSLEPEAESQTDPL